MDIMSDTALHTNREKESYPAEEIKDDIDEDYSEPIITQEPAMYDPELADEEVIQEETSSADDEYIPEISANTDKEIAEDTPKRRSFAETAYHTISENENVNQTIGKAYRKVKKSVIHTESNEPQVDNNPKKKQKKYKHGYSQDLLPISSIWNGIIKTTSGKYVKILEVLPINFNDCSITDKNEIAKVFGTIFHNGPVFLHLKCIVDKNNPSRIISFIKSKCEEEKWQRGISKEVVECAQDVINKIADISNNSALTKRYFVIYQYEGRKSDPEEIYNDLETTKFSIMNTFAGCGNVVVDSDFSKLTVDAGEILYYCLNRNTCREESLQDRIERVVSDFEIYNQSSKKQFEPSDVDFLSPKGIYFSKSGDYWYQEGVYKTAFSLMQKGHPDNAEIGWMNHFTSLGEGTELDIYVKRYPRDLVAATLEQYSRIERVSAINSKNSEKRERKLAHSQKNLRIVNALKAEQDLSDVYIMVTITADSIRSLRLKKTAILKEFNKKKLFLEEASFNCIQYFISGLPLMELNSSLFSRNKANYLTSSLESLYMYTSYEFYDPNGYVLGENMAPNNKSLVSINNFNTSLFTNANMAIFGMTGSGKTFSTEILARSLRLIGVRVFFILPIKAYEYKRGSDAIGGQFVQLRPGSEQRINICEIRPAQPIDRLVLTESTQVPESLLAQKITSLTTWISLNRLREPLSEEEIDLIGMELKKMYTMFGFTDNNDSAWLDKENHVVRPSPIISDIYDRFMQNPRLKRCADSIKKYIFGTCANMNGPTNIDIHNMYNCIDVDSRYIPEDLLPSFLFIATEWAYGLIRESRLSLDAIIMDETWKLLVNEESSKQLIDMSKLIRGYGGALITATQDINDMLNNYAGKSIVSASATKIIMHLEAPEARKIVDELMLPEEYMQRFVSFKRGEALLLTGTNRVFLKITSSQKELRDFTTDPNVLKRLNS